MKKLKLLFATLALLVGGVSNSMANQTLTVDGVYYIQNVETGLFGGTRAPQLPANAQVLSQQVYDKNVIINYIK